ncbi:MAG: DUF342 domain-containing protein [Solirubrobacterales bacterium]
MSMNLESNSATIKVSISPDGMEASLFILIPPGGKPATMEAALSALREDGVVEGIDHEQVRHAIQEYNAGRSISVARGISAQDGLDGRLEYHFELPDDDKMKPAEMEDGRVDYRNLNLINNVRRGELLVTRIPPKLGQPGTTVTGKPVVPKMGKSVPMPRGKNTVADEGGNYLYASSDGHVSIIDNKVTVNQVFEVAGDVDFASGNIEFVGNVFVRGNITSGFTVKAGGDVEVNGVIESAQVFAAGNILVKNGITGGHKAYVRAGGSIFAKFIENARIEAGNDVVINDAIVQSFVRANNYVRCEGRKGTIVGGTIQAGEEISAKVLGSALTPATVLEVGVNPVLREEYKTVMQQYAEKKRAFENVCQYLAVYQKSAVSLENLPDKRKLAVLKLLEDYKTQKVEVANLEDRKIQLETELEKMQRGRVKVHDIVYPGVQIVIGQAMYTVNDPLKYAMFIVDQGEVRMTSLR